LASHAHILEDYATRFLGQGFSGPKINSPSSGCPPAFPRIPSERITHSRHDGSSKTVDADQAVPISPCSPHRRARLRGLPERAIAACPRALRAILQRQRSTNGTSVAKPLLRWRPGAGPSLEGARVCGAQPGAGGNRAARDYRWSSAAAHITGHDESGLLDMDWWRQQPHANWEPFLNGLPNQPDEALRACTHAGRPFGSEDFLRQMAHQFDRHWTRGRPKKKPPVRPRADSTEQLSLF
jgi:hypothetical protein